MSCGWWMRKHTRHHADPNHEGLDPDVEPGAIAFTAEQAMASRGVTTFVDRHQVALFFPLPNHKGMAMPDERGDAGPAPGGGGPLRSGQ